MSLIKLISHRVQLYSYTAIQVVVMSFIGEIVIFFKKSRGGYILQLKPYTWLVLQGEVQCSMTKYFSI